VAPIQFATTETTGDPRYTWGFWSAGPHSPDSSEEETSMADTATLSPLPPELPGKVKPLLRGWLHFGALVAVLVCGPILITNAKNTGQTVALSIYVTSLCGLFGVSALFHRITWSPRARRIMRRADHSTIFIGIAGTYTAVAVLALHGGARVAILLVAWIGAAGGLALRQLWLDAPKWAVAIPYVVVGWCALLVVPELVRGLGGGGFALIGAGGIAYTLGALVYAAKRPDPAPSVFGYHEVFHSCTIVGATLHFVAIAFIALPRS
jgi:hemolysin III